MDVLPVPFYQGCLRLLRNAVRYVHNDVFVPWSTEEEDVVL